MKYNLLRNPNNLMLFCALIGSGITASNQALAVGNFQASKSDLALLPPYCTPKARDNGNNNKLLDVRLWSKKLGGKNYIHIHHYCAGLQALGNARSSFGEPDRKAFLLGRAERNIQYSILHATPRFFLHPEMALKLGNVYEAQNKPGMAQAEYRKAIKHKKSYSRSYSAAHKLFLKSGNRKQAREILEEGIVNAPKSKLLKRLLAKMN